MPLNRKESELKKVLVVDDEKPIVEVIAYNLRKEGYAPFTAYDADQCLELFFTEKPDLIILDVMLPSASGFDICKQIRKQSDVPIILLTARAEESDRVIGLELGADDYVVKPFSVRELIARVKTILRRSGVTAEISAEKPIVDGDLIITPNRFEVTLAGRQIDLSPKEFELLRYLVAHPDHVFSRQALLDEVWGMDAYVEERTIDVHIRWLREKIEKAPSQPENILTVRGIGYKYRRKQSKN